MRKGRTFRNRCKQKPQKPLSLDYEPQIISLHQALKSANFINTTRLQLRDFPATGRGVSSSINLRADSILIKIPTACLIAPHAIQLNDLPFLRDNKVTTQTLLALYICIESHKGRGSRWQYYLDSLPADNPLTWLAPEAISIRPPQWVASRMSSHWQQCRNTYAASWQTAIRAFGASSQTQCGCCGRLMHTLIDEPLFRWAYAMVNTRAVYINPDWVRHRCDAAILNILLDEPRMALCPFLDMFNHSDEMRTTAEIVTEGKEEIYVIRTHHHHKRYEQIFISYGEHDNVHLYLEYGFFLPANKFDVFRFEFEDVCGLFKDVGKAKFNYIKAKGFDRELYVTRCEISFNLKALLFICFATTDLKDIGRIYGEGYRIDEVDRFRKVVGTIMQLSPPMAVERHSDAMTQRFYEYLIDFPIKIMNNLRDGH